MMRHSKVNVNDLVMRIRREGVSLWEENGKLRYRAPQGVLEISDLQTLKDYKKDILHLLQSESQPITNEHCFEARFEPFPLTDVQSAYLLGRNEVFGYGGVSCHIYLELNYPELDPIRTEKVWNQLVSRHDMLRAVISKDGYQQVKERVPQLYVVYTDASTCEQAKVEKKLSEIREEMGHRIYSTDCWPLFGVAVTRTCDRAVLHFSIEFLIADWASIWLLLSEFEILYYGVEQTLPELNYSFRNYLLAERSLRESSRYANDRDYWLGRVDNLPLAPDLPKAKIQKGSGKVRFSRRFLQLDVKTWSLFKQKAQQRGLTPTTAVMTAYAAVIERWSRNKNFCLNLTVLNRLPLHPCVNHIVGDFTTVSLLAVDWDAGNSFTERAKIMNKQLFEDMDHRLFSGVEVLREISRRRGRESALMPIVFTSAIGLIGATEENRLKGKVEVQGISQTPQVFIDCQAMDNSSGLQINWDIRDGVFPAHMTDDMFDAFAALMLLLAESDDAWNLDHSIPLPEWQISERKRMNNTYAPLPDGLLHSRILEQAAAAPDRIAVIDSEEQVTYDALMLRASAVVEKLSAAGCRRQDRVAIIMDKSVHQVAAILGTLSIGAVYVPIDVRQPKLRCTVMLKKTEVRYVLTCSANKGEWPEGITAIEVDKLKPHRQNILVAEGDPDSSAYIIYTSGSAGEPKGVIITHRAALNTVKDINSRFRVGGNDSILGLAQLSFDLSVYDIFGILSVGGKLIYPSADRQTDPSHWAELMAEHEVTVWNSVPALMQMLIAYLISGQKSSLPKFRLALLSGDWIPLTLPDTLIKCIPSANVVSLGGATEASIWSIFHIYRGLQPDWSSIPYGRPLTNQGFRVLDEKMRDCPVWVAGELYISGDGLAKGYFGDEKTTKERFFNHPVDGTRLYRTGDMGRYTCGGEIEFLGRDDNQVKIKGHRIELGEIESTLLKHPFISAAGVVVDGTGEDKVLLGVIEAACCQNWKAEKAKSEFDKMVNGIGELANTVATGLNKQEVDRMAKNLDKAVLHSMLNALLNLGVFANGGRYSMEDILESEGINPKFHWLMRRWIAKLTIAGLLLEDSEKQFVCPRKPEAASIDKYWEQAEETWAKGFTAYVRSNAEKLPELLSGRQDPVSLLFPEGKTDHVQALYFDHVMVRYLNQCICILVKRIAEQQDRPLRILEVGAGTGATTEKVLKALEGFEVDYLFTDVTPFFISGAKTRFGQFPGMRFGIFDIDEDYRVQGLAPNSFDIVLAAGVLENACNIPESMDRLEQLICPGGWLIFTEPTKEHAWILASQAFMMTEPGDDLRRETSYLERHEWIQLLEASGDEPILTLPEEQHELFSLGVHLFAKRLKQDKLRISLSEVEEFLSGRLPAYMIPSDLQVVDALPLTSNGKIDRKELARWRIKPVIEQFTAVPEAEISDVMEMQLAQVWSQALGVPAIGRLQNFYDHGADSLIMAQVAGKLRELLAGASFKMDIPFDTLLRQMLNYPTIAALAEFVRSQNNAVQNDCEAAFDGEKPSSSNAVLTSHGGGDSGPLRVVFHAGIGTMNCFRLLFSHLDKQKLGPVVGITIADTEVYCSSEAESLIEQLADDYAERLVGTGHNKMQLIGYSLGGIVAVEVARRLLEQGIQLEDLILIDSHPILYGLDDDLFIELLFVPNLHISLEQAGFGGLNTDDLVRAALRIFEENNNVMPAGALLGISGDKGLDQVSSLFRRLSALSQRERFTAYVNAVAKYNNDHMPVEMAEGLFDVYRQSLKSASFRPQPYMGDIRFLLATEPFPMPGTDEMTLDFWNEVCLGKFSVQEVSGNHLTCLETEPNASKLAEVIGAVLINNKRNAS